ncbi:MAG: S46 family peptidase [Candidatus Krumholzibacteriota bacterium]|nr:S46 family peptidase [Candidatus Krumholzibacteriota bacterium]
MRAVCLSVVALCLVLAAVPVGADEGMWQLDKLDKDLVRKMNALGLELSQKEIFTPKGGGIAYAIVDLGGGTGSFVSSRGLVLTNHHVAFGALQRASTTENNYIRDGFHAPTTADEIPARGYEVGVLRSIEDVTKKVLGAVDDGMTPLERFEAIERVRKELIAGAEEGGDVRCEIAELFGGMEYKLFTYFFIRDVRLVYAPPEAIGNYGGDIDNWMWPRHGGDFSFLRAYVAPDGSPADYSEENVPYEPAVHLAMSTGPLAEGDFVMIMGYPGSTYRHRSSYSIDHAENFLFPRRVAMFGGILDIIQEASAADGDAAIKLARLDAMLNNSMKNYQGQLEGFRKAGLLARKQAEEREFTAWLLSEPEMAARYGDVLPGIAVLYEENMATREIADLARLSGFLSQMMRAAGTIYKWSVEKEKPDMDRDPGFQERDLPDLAQGLEMLDRGYHPATDRAILAFLLRMAADLPANQRLVAFDEMIEREEGATVEDRIESLLDRLYGGTKLGDAGERMRMFELSREDLLAEKDPFIEFAAAIRPQLDEIEETGKAWNGAITALRPRLIEAKRRWRGGSFYPDATSTIRLTYGTIAGYSPRDAVEYGWITRLGGVVEKHTGETPFDCPDALLDLYERRDFGRYRDEALDDVPVDFLSTCDITGGNSGSPIMNARGEVIGAAFDGNWESISADYLFNEDLTRTISVDSRYILFILEQFSGATSLLEEMSIH